MQNIDCLFSRGLIVAVDDVKGLKNLPASRYVPTASRTGQTSLGFRAMILLSSIQPTNSHERKSVPTHYCCNAVYFLHFFQQEAAERSQPSDVAGLDLLAVVPERRHRRGGLQRRRRLQDDDRRADLERRFCIA
jgi:hypothetical protein